MVRTMFSKYLVLILAMTINASLAASVAARLNDPAVLAPRQTAIANPPTTGGTTGSMPLICQNYAMVANYSTIALNSTLRGAFLRSAPMGTVAAIAILDTQAPKLMAMKFDQTLNDRCGNLSEIALTEAGNNLTKGIVADFTILEAPGVGTEGFTTPAVMIAISIVFSVVWLSL